jgi:hypothetical protein
MSKLQHPQVHGRAMEKPNLDGEAYCTAFVDMKLFSESAFTAILGSADDHHDMAVEAQEICFYAIKTAVGPMLRSLPLRMTFPSPPHSMKPWQPMKIRNCCNSS